jgi:hypothetical protein
LIEELGRHPTFVFFFISSSLCPINRILDNQSKSITFPSKETQCSTSGLSKRSVLASASSSSEEDPAESAAVEARPEETTLGRWSEDLSLQLNSSRLSLSV